MWEEGAPNLPVDYYENDDGFWDGIISEKLKRYDQFKPMLKTRRHFTHWFGLHIGNLRYVK